MRKLAVLAVAGLALAACRDVPPPTAADAGAARLLAASGAEVIPGQYIVVFRDGVSDVRGQASRLTAAHGGTLRYTYTAALRGFAANLSENAAAALARNPNVAYVEQDQVMRAIATQTLVGGEPWGLDRIDQASLPLSGTYTYGRTGLGVGSYIIDTGIDYSHPEFHGRVSPGFDAFTDGRNGADCNGHGTHVAGTLGGTTYGVAKLTHLYAVRVLDCQGSGTTSGVIAGVDWVTANHVKPAVANMSLGGGASSSLDNAVSNSIAAGVSYAVAAGNGDFIGRPQNACNYSPARVSTALTVGATSKTDTEASWSNYGTCVNILAPGVAIKSAWHNTQYSSDKTRSISGTSMASPHVAGVAALYLEAEPAASPSQVFQAVVNNAVTGKITLHSASASNETPNRLLQMQFTGGDGETPPPPPPEDDDPPEPEPPASITLDATGSKVRGISSVDLAWNGATSTSVDIFRNGSHLVTTSNSGSHTDTLGRGASGTFTYQVCEAGTSTCSNQAIVTF